MGTERQVMQDYLDTLAKREDFPHYFTADVVATFESTGQRAEGRDAAGQLIRYVHQGPFDARMELKNLLTDQGKAGDRSGLRRHPYRRVRRDPAHRPEGTRPLLRGL